MAVCGILLPVDDLLRVERLAVGALRTSSSRLVKIQAVGKATCLPRPASEKKVLNASSHTRIVLSDGI
jgi:hypothetical protein